MTPRQRWVLLVALVLLAAATAVAGLRPAEPATLDQRVHDVAGTLGCPACQAESVADSADPMAQGMRAVIRTRLAEGESPEQVQAYFVELYGEGILLEPPFAGSAALLWLAPLAALTVGTGAALWLVARRRPGTGSESARTPDHAPSAPEPDPGAEPGPAESSKASSHAPSFRAPSSRTTVLAVSAAVVLGGVLVAALADAVAPRAPGAPATGGEISNESVSTGGVLAGRTLEQAGDLQGAAEIYRAELARRPDHREAAFRLGFVLARLGQPAEAEPVLAQVVQARPDHPEALLLLGTVQRQLGREEADATLRRFLEIAPEDHEAAAEVRRLLEEQR